MKHYLLAVLILAFSQSYADLQNGKDLYKMYCASCHGPEGAGLIGPNLTDELVLHGTAIPDIVSVISTGVSGKAMPAWNAILSDAQIEDVALFVKSIMGKNLPSTIQTGSSLVTPFPQGSLTQPLLLRTFMPQVESAVDLYSNHYEGRETPNYSAKTGEFHPDKKDLPIEGIPGAIAVNFGDTLSYCFDTTECQLLYTWSGPFVDMSHYWGEGFGGRRKPFDYIGRLMGSIAFTARGVAPLQGKPQFKGYRKVNHIPEFLYSIDQVDFTLKIMPGENAGDAICQFTTNNWKGKRSLQFDPGNAQHMSSDKGVFKNGVLTLNKRESKSFTITIKGGNETL